MDLAAREKQIDRNRSWRAFRFDAVVDGVFQQRLQHERRHQRIGRHALDVPIDEKARAQPQLFELEILATQLDLVGERR